MKLSQTCFLFLFLSLACSADTIQGNVQNGTTRKPEPGCPVTLFTAAGEKASATTNDDGEFQIELSRNLASGALAILKVTHGGVEYYQNARPGRTVNFRVYEASSQVKGISGYLSVLQFQVKGKLLDVTELHAFDNTSSPPLTQVGPGNLVFSIPEGSQLQSATISEPDGGTLKLPIQTISVQNGKYGIDFPMKPGLTKYAISYQVPYDGKFVFRRRAQYSTNRIGIILPDSMRFHSLGTKSFHATASQPGTHEQVLDWVNANELFAFELSGSGVLSHYFRPLNPGEPSMSAKSKAVNVPPPHAVISEPNASVTPASSGSGEYRMAIVASVLGVAGILCCGKLLKRTFRM